MFGDLKVVRADIVPNCIGVHPLTTLDGIARQPAKPLSFGYGLDKIRSAATPLELQSRHGTVFMGGFPFVWHIRDRPTNLWCFSLQ
jgi:hypothetical protein